MEVSEEIKRNQIVLVVISKSEYIPKSLDVTRIVEKNFTKICYVALNKPYNSIVMGMKNNNIDPSKFYFIDVLTATVETPVKVDNCTFVESPNAITDLSLSFSEAMLQHNCDNALFDAISTLIIHQGESSVVKLAQNLMTKIRVSGKKAVFITLKEDSDTLIKDLTMFVDSIVNL